MRGAEAVLACLREQGVDTLFGYPGGGGNHPGGALIAAEPFDQARR